MPDMPDGQSGRRGRGLRTLRAAMRSSTMRRVQVTFLVFRTAERASWVALLIWTFDRGGEAAVGVIAVAQLLPATAVAPFASVFASVFADRVSRPKALRSG